MSHFIGLKEAVRAMATDPSTANDPIKRMFLCDGRFASVNIAILEGTGNALHTQKDHDEVVVILGGEADFRVGDETRPVREGDLIFIPENTIHGPILRDGAKLETLSVFAPFFDRARDNIVWDEEAR